MWQRHDSAYDTSTTQWWARMMKEWCAWEYLVRRTIISLERVTKDSEMKWVVTKGNENLSIIPLSFLGDLRRPMWVADRRSEFRMIRMGLDRVWNVNVSTIGSWIKGLGLWAKPSSNFYCFLLESVPMVLTQPGTPVSFRGMCICSLFDFWKLRIFRCFPFPENSGTPTFPISRNSGLRRFPIFLYYVITLFSCLHLSLVTPSTVVSTSLSPDPQFPFALLYCFRLCNSDPLLCTRYKLVPFLSYCHRAIFHAHFSPVLSTLSLMHSFSSLPLSLLSLFFTLLSCYRLAILTNDSHELLWFDDYTLHFILILQSHSFIRWNEDQIDFFETSDGYTLTTDF